MTKELEAFRYIVERLQCVTTGREDYISNIYPKLETLEQYFLKMSKLEGEIGCPLEVFVKLHNVASIYDNYGKQHKIRKVQGDVVIVDSELIYFPLNEYQNTWWLREDKEE